MKLLALLVGTVAAADIAAKGKCDADTVGDTGDACIADTACCKLGADADAALGAADDEVCLAEADQTATGVTCPEAADGAMKLGVSAVAALAVALYM